MNKFCCEKCGYPTDEWVIIEEKLYCIDCADKVYEEKEKKEKQNRK